MSRQEQLWNTGGATTAQALDRARSLRDQDRQRLAELAAELEAAGLGARPDKLTFGMMLGIPLLQLILFGFVINSDPKHLPTAVLLADYGPQGRTLLQAIQNSGYFDLRLHPRYNPEAITQYHIIPGLMGVVLTMTMIMITGLAITRERERGTMENLLSMPTRPFEVLAGKIIPYILVGLPSMMLSGFMFPFRGMPVWAQYIGEVLPLTHFLRIVRGIMLKGNGFNEVIYDLGAIALFGVVILMIAVKRYRQTLD